MLCSGFVVFVLQIQTTRLECLGVCVVLVKNLHGCITLGWFMCSGLIRLVKGCYRWAVCILVVSWGVVLSVIRVLDCWLVV